MRWKGNKADQQRAHLRRRARDRFGVDLHQQAEAALVAQIQSGSAPFVERQTNRVGVFTVTLPNGQMANAVYDSARHQVVTLLFIGERFDPFAFAG
jgi:hypothetical protein